MRDIVEVEDGSTEDYVIGWVEERDYFGDESMGAFGAYEEGGGFIRGHGIDGG